MIRVLFSVLAVVAVVLAFVLDKPGLYVAAAVLLLIALILLIEMLRRRHREARTPYMSTSSTTQADELKSLGIMEIRPKERSQPRGSEANGRAAAAQEPPALARAEAAPSMPSRPLKVYEAQPVADVEIRAAEASETQEPETAAEQPAQAAQDAAGVAGEQVLVPYLQALRSVVGAQTVCLFKQENIAPEYHVVVYVTEEQVFFEAGSFETPAPLLTARMTQNPVTVRHVGVGGLSIDSLGYSARPSAVRQVALAPVPRPRDPNTYFLLADATEDDLFDQARPRTLLAQFARLLGSLLEAPDVEQQQAARPRREIIAEEMERARDRNVLLALAFVYLNRAEALADEGEAAVAAAERLLEARLWQIARHGRIVRFGELTYGVFYDGDILDVEAWGAHMQHAFTDETGPLAGGVSVGIALLQDRHRDPDEFRDDATAALREAFESGTCTIVE